MFNIGDEVLIKDLETLVKENKFKLADGLDNVYINHDTHYAIFPDFNFFGSPCTIDTIDENDKDIPYFLSIGIWVPEFMIMKKPQKEVKPKNDEVNVERPNIFEEAAREILNQKKQKVYINQFNGKPFGKLFLKLIDLDPKIAEFSNTNFSKLKKHELLYIARLLKNKGVVDVPFNNLTQKELVTLCYNATKKL